MTSTLADAISPQVDATHVRAGTADVRMAVLVPCKDEEVTIGSVIAAFRAALPGAAVWVCDNGSRDNTALYAAEAGAIVNGTGP